MPSRPVWAPTRMARHALGRIAGGVLLTSCILVGCGDENDALDADAGPDSETASDAGAGSDGGECADGEAFVDGACVPAAVCESGLDEDGDGICDRAVADWSRNAMIPEGGDRADIYQLGDAQSRVVTRGVGHTLIWPVDVSGVLLPWDTMTNLLDPDTEDPTTLASQNLARNALGFGNTNEMYDWLGLANHDGDSEVWPGVAWPDWVQPGDPLGVGRLERETVDVMSFSCATCHTADLFGRTVVGMTNREARANEFFHLAAGFFPAMTPEILAGATGAEGAELTEFIRTQGNLAAIGSVPPQVLGLDTSLAQVSLSLARREEDAYATRNPELESNPRPNLLEDYVADSKPAVWWTLRYKTRWLSDGSIVSGNPIFTNFLWNEIGRGTDLIELEAWLNENQDIVDELTVMAFATEAPRWEDWFGVDSIDLAAARRGQVLFESTCSTCHGTYDKGWDAADAATLSLREQLATTRVTYHRQTPVMNVGTDPQRARGMEAFADRLNELAISQAMDTVVEVQDGYVPPPLDGIWARYPYLHNQSVPTLCDLLVPSEMRTSEFYMGPSADAETDFDFACVGYPVGDAIPASWLDNDGARFDTTQPGLRNTGHDEWLRADDGSPLFDEDERRDLIEFLKTL